MESFIGMVIGAFLAIMCSFGTITPTKYEQALVKCNLNDGIERVTIPTLGSDSVRCVNGAKFQLGDK